MSCKCHYKEKGKYVGEIVNLELKQLRALTKWNPIEWTMGRLGYIYRNNEFTISNVRINVAKYTPFPSMVWGNDRSPCMLKDFRNFPRPLIGGPGEKWWIFSKTGGWIGGKGERGRYVSKIVAKIFSIHGTIVVYLPTNLRSKNKQM